MSVDDGTTRRHAGEPIEILLVEDNPGDVRLTREALRKGRIANNLHVVTDGQAAVDFLKQEGEHGDAPRPHLVLLDLRLPKKSGLEVLEEVKETVQLRRIPIVVLTSSKAEEDIARSYDLHANAYVTKPVEVDDFLEAVRSMEQFWLSVVRLPEG